MTDTETITVTCRGVIINYWNNYYFYCFLLTSPVVKQATFVTVRVSHGLWWRRLRRENLPGKWPSGSDPSQFEYHGTTGLESMTTVTTSKLEQDWKISWNCDKTSSATIIQLLRHFDYVSYKSMHCYWNPCVTSCRFLDPAGQLFLFLDRATKKPPGL